MSCANKIFKLQNKCGSDHFLKCNALISLRKPSLGVVVMKRPGYSNNNIVTTPHQHLFVVDIDQGDADVSSTLIRKRLEKGESISDLVFNGVEQYIKDNKIKFT